MEVDFLDNSYKFIRTPNKIVYYSKKEFFVFLTLKKLNPTENLLIPN